MQRHHEKRRDMARSILPSKNREAARQALCSAKRANRRVVAQQLQSLVGVAGADPSQPATYENWDERGDARQYADAEISWTVRRRRSGDKLAHFIRWAIVVSADLPVEDRLPYIRSLLPDGLIGRHAMSHLAWEPELVPLQEHNRRLLTRRDSATDSRTGRRARQRAAREDELAVLATLLGEVLETGGELEVLNRAMKTCDTHADRSGCLEAGCVLRCLAGHHDVDAFLRDIEAAEPSSWRVADAPAAMPARCFTRYLVALRGAASIGPSAGTP